MLDIPSITRDVETLRRNILSTRDPDQIQTLEYMVAALQQGQEAFLRCLENEDFERGKEELSDALFVFPAPQVWTFLAIVIAMSEGMRLGVEALFEMVNFVGNPRHKAFDNAMKLFFPLIYVDNKVFLSRLQGGLDDNGITLLKNNPSFIPYNIDRIRDYANYIKRNDMEMGEFVDEFASVSKAGLEQLIA